MFRCNLITSPQSYLKSSTPVPYLLPSVSLRPKQLLGLPMSDSTSSKQLPPILKQTGTVSTPPKRFWFQLNRPPSTMATRSPGIRGAKDSGATTHCLPYSYQGGAHQDVHPTNSIGVICANNSIINSLARDMLDLKQLP